MTTAGGAVAALSGSGGSGRGGRLASASGGSLAGGGSGRLAGRRDCGSLSGGATSTLRAATAAARAASRARGSLLTAFLTALLATSTGLTTGLAKLLVATVGVVDVEGERVLEEVLILLGSDLDSVGGVLAQRAIHSPRELVLGDVNAGYGSTLASMAGT